MTLQQLKYIVTVAETGTITEAANQLYISQPSLTNAIHELEKEMHITIFHRSNKGIRLSKEGEDFLGYARQVLEQASILEDKYKKNNGGKKKFCVSTQHYSFAVNAFVDLIQEYGQEEYDFVDVRIMFPTGEDLTVLSKKSVHNLIRDNCVFNSYLTEDEILRMASATVDAYTVTGSYIYTTRYVEPNLQEESVPNYVVRPEVIDLINSDPNILSIAKETLNLEARINLEQRLIGLSEDTLKAVSEGHGIADTAKRSALLGVQYSAESEDSEELLEEGTTENTEAATEGSSEETQAP